MEEENKQEVVVAIAYTVKFVIDVVAKVNEALAA